MPDQKPNWGGEPQAFMPAPTTSPQPQTAATAEPADLGRMMREPAPKPVRGYYSFELPDSILDSAHFRGTPADLIFGIWPPTSSDIKKAAKREADFNEEARNYIAMLGATGQDGRVVPCPNPDHTTQVMPWWGRLGPKAQQLVTTVFVEMFIPNEDEKKSVAGSKNWVG